MPGKIWQTEKGQRLSVIALAVAAVVAPGCSVLRYAKLVCIDEPKLFCERHDDIASMATYRSWADEAWAEHGLVCPDSCVSGDYSWGFREGFAEYVYAGGDGQPPALPPRPYWQLDVRTPDGAIGVNSWFAGYRHGAQLARDGGYRERVTLTVSASLADCDACGCPDEPNEKEQHSTPRMATPSKTSEEIEAPTPIRQPTELSLPSLFAPEPSLQPQAVELEERPVTSVVLPMTSTSGPFAKPASVHVPLVPYASRGPGAGARTGNAIFQITR